MDRTTRKALICPYPGCEFTRLSRQEIDQHITAYHDGKTQPDPSPFRPTSAPATPKIPFSPLPRTEQETVYRCDVKGCEFTATNREGMIPHLLAHDFIRRIYCCECPGCEFRTWNERDLQEHFATHDPRSIRWYCPECGAMYEEEGAANICCLAGTPTRQTCRTCHGYKLYQDQVCSICGGEGAVPTSGTRPTFTLTPRYQDCPDCRGSGKGALFFRCSRCKGSGQIPGDPPHEPHRSVPRHNGYRKELV